MTTKLLIFGLTGDLGRRKLLPALRQIINTGQFDDLEIIGVSRRTVDVSELLKESLGDDSLRDRVSVFTMDLANASDYIRLKESLALQDDEQLLVYLSVPPSASTQIVDFMGEAGITTPNVKILFEKPFGVDVVSAKDFIARTARYYTEDQIYRIDHYLAKEMAQDLVAFRGGNALFSRLWNNQAIESIDIIAAETLDIEGRAIFYEQTGALRDVVQGHLLQLLALAILDIPHDFDWDTLPRLRFEALADLEPAKPEVAHRAQYKGYQDEVKNPGSLTETFASVTLYSNNKRWQGVPFRLIAGKALNKKETEVRVHLKKEQEAQSNTIVFNIQPNEGIHIELYVKKPGYDRVFERRTLGFRFPEDELLPDAYEQVIVDAIRSKKSLFAEGDEVVRSWELLADVQAAWSLDDTALPIYEKGTNPLDIA